MNLPKHWITSRLAELVIIRKGKKPDKLSFKPFPDAVPYLDILAIEKGIINQYADSYSTVLAQSTDVFIVADGSRSGLVGKGAVGAVGSTLLCITPLSIDNLYLYYFLRLKYEELNGNTTGASIPHLNLELFMNLEVAFPSIEEQKRIVAELQNQLTVFEKDFSNAEQELLKLGEFRKSMLNQAVIGNLTVSAEGGEINASTKLPKSWQVVTIEDLSEFIGSGVTPSGGSSNYREKGIPFLRSQNVYPNELRLNDVAYISAEMHHQMKRTHVKPKDVLLNITGASIGRSAYIPAGFGEGNVNQHVCIIRPNELVLPEYLSLFLNSPTGQDNINSLQKGVTRQGLNYDQIRSIKINLPPKEEQLEIIRQVEIQDKNIHDLENPYSSKINNTSQLEKAVMQMAFDGNISSAEEGDSGAAALLEVIEQKRKEINQDMAKIRLAQTEKSRPHKIKLDKKTLTTFIKENFSDKTFTSDELFKSLEIDNEYVLFNDLLFDLLQEKLSAGDREPFLEAVYDDQLKRQTLTIKRP